MKEHVQIHRFYSSALGRSLRLLLLCILLLLTVYGFSQGQLPKYALFFLLWMAMIEVFFHFSLSRTFPKVPVAQNDGKNPLDSYTHTALDTFLSSARSEEIVRNFLRLPQIRFLLERIPLAEKEVPLLSLNTETWMANALATAKARRGIYITSMDCFVTYLRSIEAQTKLLFAKELKPEDLDEILVWANMAFLDEEHPREYKIAIAGDGMGEALTTGWTPETKQYTTDFTHSAIRKSRTLIGREKEYEQVVTGLSRPEMNNILIVGEAGVGKEKLIETLAHDSFKGELHGSMNHKRIITLMVGPFMAGAENRSDLETRLQAIIAELSHAGNIILFIPELQEIMGESSYNMNLSGALLPYLKDGSLPIIATMTPGNYKAYMEPNGLREVFSTIRLQEPEKSAARAMVYKNIPDVESTYGVIIPYRTVMTAVDLAKKYLPDDVLPGSVLRLISDAAQAAGTAASLHNRRVVLPDTVVRLVEGKVHAAVAAPKKEEKDLLLHLEQKLHERIIGQEKAITVIAEAMRRLRSGVTKSEKPISFLFLGPTGVGKTETAKALADLYFGGEEKMLRLDMSEYVDEAGVHRLLGAPPGSGAERGELTDKIHDNPYTLVLLDEFEKAHPKILDLFLQVLSDGRLTDNKGRTVSFTNAIIIATSNAGSEFVREEVKKGVSVDAQFQEKLLEFLQTNHLFKPELLNRFDGVVTFTPLTAGEASDVTKLLLRDVVKRLGDQDITIQFEDSIYGLVAKEGYDEQFGARPLRRYIQDTIEDRIAKLTLEEKLKRGDTLRFSVDEAGTITSRVQV